MAGKTAVAAAQASSSMKKSSPDITRGIVNRMKGITRATDKLTKEEADLEEKLVGGQKKLDHNKNGKIDSHDFHLMRKKKMKEEVEGLDEISRDLARRYIRKIADKTNTGELSVKQVEKRRPGLNLAGKKAYPSIAGEPKVRATD
jgi:chemotaxis receptor (MCP) glutamine deamidase CheD